MFNLNLGDFPNKIKQDVLYMLYYTFNAFIPWLLAVIIMNQYNAFPHKLNDYQFMVVTLVYAAITGYGIWFLNPSPEKIAIKRRHFVIGLIHILSDSKKMSFEEILKYHSYCVFGNKKTSLTFKEYSKTLIILINLGIIELVNQKDFQNECHEFDFELFANNIEKMIFRLKTKDVNLDEVVRRSENYLF